MLIVLQVLFMRFCLSILLNYYLHAFILIKFDEHFILFFICFIIHVTTTYTEYYRNVLPLACHLTHALHFEKMLKQVYHNLGVFGEFIQKAPPTSY